MHSVHFYAQDPALLDALNNFIGTALGGGAAAIVLATKPHRDGLLTCLRNGGLDPSKAIHEGRFILLDTCDTLGQIMDGDLPDAVRFNQLMGELLTRARNAAEDPEADVAVFGELVAGLWAGGKTDAAIHLEQLWNGLAKHHRFSLRCGYPINGFFREDHSEPFQKICAEHSAVIPSEPYTDLDTEQKRLRSVAHLQQKAQVLQYQQALQHSEQRFRLFVEAVRDYAIFMLDPEGRVITWNTGAKRIKGYEAAEIIGQHFSQFYPEEDVRAEKPQRELEIAARDGRLEDEGWRVRRDGSRFWANVIITALHDQSGNLLGFGKVTRDFTERMRAQEALRAQVAEKVAAQAKLRESEKSLRRLSLHLLRTQDEERRRIGRELHDSLGQYLSVLKMKIDALSRSTDGSGQVGQDIAECARLAEESIKEVRTISYLLYPPMLEEMGLKSAVPWYLDGFTRRSGIQTTFEISPDFRRLSADVELAMFRILQESLTNVHRHSGSSSAAVRLLLRERAAVLQVIDQGKGMPAAVLEQTGQDWMGALGVGLRGMMERIRQLGGTLELSSTTSGTTVTAMVPMEAPGAAGPPESVLEMKFGESPKSGLTKLLMNPRILIVDDHEVVREGIRTLISRARPGWQICGEAINGPEAVNQVSRLDPHVVILDITMPGMSGLEVATRLKNLQVPSKILMFTMHESQRLEGDVRSAGAQGFVLKSQAARDLILAIETILGGGSFFGAPADSGSRKSDTSQGPAHLAGPRAAVLIISPAEGHGDPGPYFCGTVALRSASKVMST